MATRKVLQIGNPLLKAKNQSFKNFSDPKLKRIIKDLIDTMHKEGLIGLASPQIGQNYQLMATKPRKTKTRTGDQIDELRIYINPKIVFYSKHESIIYEGCGSVAEGNLFGPIKRPKQIIVEAFDLNKHKFRLICDGILARAIQHEYDHLFGIEFTEKIYDYKKLVNQEFYIKNIKDSNNQLKASKITIKALSKI